MTSIMCQIQLAPTGGSWPIPTILAERGNRIGGQLGKGLQQYLPYPSILVFLHEEVGWQAALEMLEENDIANSILDALNGCALSWLHFVKEEPFYVAIFTTEKARDEALERLLHLQEQQRQQKISTITPVAVEAMYKQVITLQ